MKKQVLFDRVILDRVDRKILLYHKNKVAYRFDIDKDVTHLFLPYAEYDPDFKGKILTYDDWSEDNDIVVKYADVTLYAGYEIIFWFGDIIVQRMDMARLFLLANMVDHVNINFDWIGGDRRISTENMDIEEVDEGFIVTEHFPKPFNFNEIPTHFDDVLVDGEDLLLLLNNNVIQKRLLSDISKCKFVKNS